MPQTPLFTSMEKKDYGLLNSSSFQKDVVRYNMFYDIITRPHFSIKSTDNSCIAMKNNDKALWLWTKEADEQKTEALLDALALYLKNEKIECLSAAPAIASSFASKYCALTGCRHNLYLPFSAYYARELPTLSKIPGRLIRPLLDQAPLLAGFLVGFHKETFGLELSFHTQLKNAAVFITSGKLYCWQVGRAITSMGLLSPYPEKFARLNYIYTSPLHRNQGYGKTLTAMLSVMALQKELLPVLYTGLHNQPAINLYTSLRFVESGRIDEIKIYEVKNRKIKLMK